MMMLIQLSLEVLIRVVLIEELIVLLVFLKIAIYNSLLLIQVSCELIFYVNFVVLILDFAKLLKIYTSLLKHVVTCIIFENDLTILLKLVYCLTDSPHLLI